MKKADETRVVWGKYRKEREWETKRKRERESEWIQMEWIKRNKSYDEKEIKCLIEMEKEIREIEIGWLTEKERERERERGERERERERGLHPSPFPLIRRNSSYSLILPLLHFNLSSLEKGQKWESESERERERERMRVRERESERERGRCFKWLLRRHHGDPSAAGNFYELSLLWHFSQCRTFWTMSLKPFFSLFQSFLFFKASSILWTVSKLHINSNLNLK